MTYFTIRLHEDLGSGAEPTSVACRAEEIWKSDDRAILGHADFAYTASELAVQAREHSGRAMRMFTVHDGDECVAMMRCDVPQADNTNRVFVEVRALPSYDKCEILDALWPHFRRFCDEHGREVLTFWENSGQDDPSIFAASGSGGVESTAVTRWLAKRGFQLDQVEVSSTLVVDDVELPEVLVPSSYEVISWVGAAPEYLLDGLARLRARMTIDVPHGSQDVEEEKWDSQRIRADEAAAKESGRTQLWTVVVNSEGEPVGHTYLECLDQSPQIAFQLDTLVRREDRGHGLGLVLKILNLRQLQDARPQVHRVHTWNAGENEWMLAINRRLGFRPTSALGVWVIEV